MENNYFNINDIKVWCKNKNEWESDKIVEVTDVGYIDDKGRMNSKKSHIGYVELDKANALLHKATHEADESTSDGYHTFEELYRYRLLYNAAWFNELVKTVPVIKSKRHYSGEECFGGGWFIVMANLPGVGQISNHYELKDWDLFKVPEVEKAWEWDGHTPQDVAARIETYLTK